MDGLHQAAGLSEDLVVEVHGNTQVPCRSQSCPRQVINSAARTSDSGIVATNITPTQWSEQLAELGSLFQRPNGFIAYENVFKTELNRGRF